MDDEDEENEQDEDGDTSEEGESPEEQGEDAKMSSSSKNKEKESKGKKSSTTAAKRTSTGISVEDVTLKEDQEKVETAEEEKGVKLKTGTSSAASSSTTFPSFVETITASDGTKIAVTKTEFDQNGPIEGGIMICRVGEFSPLSNILRPNDVLLQIEQYDIGENGTIELRPGERTRWTHACYTGKTIGESIFMKWFRNGKS